MTVLLQGILAAFVLVTLASCDTRTEGSQPDSGRATAAGREVTFPPDQHYRVPDHQGRAVDLRAYRGKVIVLNFWATWCGPCRYEIPHLVELRKAYPEDRVAIIGVSLDQGDPDQVRLLLSQFIEGYGINYPILHDGRSELVRQFRRPDLAALVVPMTYLFDAQGRLYRVHLGVPSDGGGRPNPRKVLGAELDTLLER